MKKTLYKAMALMLSVAMCVSFTSCNDDDDDNNEIDDETVVFTDAQIDSIGYEMLLDVVAPYDTTATMPQRVVTLASCLFPAYADEYYYQADSYEEAKEHFLNVIVPACLQEKVQTSGEKLVLSVLGATITFQSASGDGKVAAIDFDLPQVSVIKTLYYVQSSAWPSNSAYTSPFSQGEICKDNNGNYYICARPSDYASGILVTVNVLHEDWYSSHTHWQGGSPFNVYNYNASREAFVTLRRYAVMNAAVLAKRISNLEKNDQKARAMASFLNDIANRTDARYIVDNTSYKTVLYWAYYYYVIWFDYYDCSLCGIRAYRTPKRTEKPQEYLGSSQITFDASFNRQGWTTVFE